jgi:hypothetical protein
VKPFVLLSALGLALLMPEVSQAAQAASPPLPGPGQKLAPKPQTPAVTPPASAKVSPYRIVCYTCGGLYPYRVAWPRIPAGYLYEFGPGCSGPQRWIWETRPQVCAYFR